MCASYIASSFIFQLHMHRTNHVTYAKTTNRIQLPTNTFSGENFENLSYAANRTLLWLGPALLIKEI